MESLIAAMTRERPEDRPCIEDVIKRFAMIRESLSKTKLRSALTSKKLPRIICPVKEAIQHVRTIQYIILRKAAIPGKDIPNRMNARVPKTYIGGNIIR